MRLSWAQNALSVDEAAALLGVTPKTVNARIRDGFGEDWKPVDNLLTTPDGLKIFVRGHGYAAGDQIELQGVDGAEARWRIESIDGDAVLLAASGEARIGAWSGARVRRVLTIRTQSLRRADLGRKMRLCHPDDIAAIQRLTVDPKKLFARKNVMVLTFWVV